MMDAVKSLTIIGAQSHENTVLRFKRYGVHRISAEGTSNSHGKSVIMKIIDALSGEFLDLESRRALIRDGSPYCIGSLESYNGFRLSVVIAHEKSDCFYMLEYKGKAIKKTLSDDYQELIKVMNFHKSEEFGYSLNRYKTKTTLPFTHFTGRQNEKILVSASEIEGYQQKLETLDEILKTIEGDLNLNKARIASAESNLNDIRYRYTKDDITNFNLFDTYVQNYTHTKEVFLGVDAVVSVHKEINQLRANKPTDFSSLGPTIKHLTSLTASMSELKKSQKARADLKELREKTKPLVDLSKVFSTLSSIGKVLELSGHLSSIKKSLSDLKVEEPPISISIVERLGKLRGSLKDTLTIQHKVESIRVEKPIVNLAHLMSLNTLRQSISDKLSVEKEIERQRVPELKLDLKIIEHLQTLSMSSSKLTSIKEQINDSAVEEVKISLDVVDRLHFMKSKLQTLRTVSKELHDVKLESSTLLTQLSSLTEEIGVCPTCGGELNIERVLEHGH